MKLFLETYNIIAKTIKAIIKVKISDIIYLFGPTFASLNSSNILSKPIMYTLTNSVANGVPSFSNGNLDANGIASIAALVANLLFDQFPER